MNNVIYLEDRRAGTHVYYPEMRDRTPDCPIEATLGHYGTHYYLDTKLELSGRGVKHLKTYTERDLAPGCRRLIGWNQYKVTQRAFDRIKAEHPVKMALYLD